MSKQACLLGLTSVLLVSMSWQVHAQQPASNATLDVFAKPGEMVDIGAGRKLNLRCSGSGTPTVIDAISRTVKQISATRNNANAAD
jgi:hypothetical protein